MKAVIDTKQLRAALSKLGTIPGQSGTNLANQLLTIECTHSGIILKRVTAVNASVRLGIAGDVITPGEFALPFNELSRAMSVFEEEKTDISLVNGELEMSSGAGEAYISGWKDVIAIEDPGEVDGQALSIEHTQLMECLRTAESASGTDRGRPELMGIAFRRCQTGLAIFGTNSHRIHYSRIEAIIGEIRHDENTHSDGGVMMPHDSAAFLIKMLDGMDGPVNLVISVNGITAQCGGMWVRLPVNEDRPSFLEFLLTNEGDCTLAIQREALSKAVRAVTPFDEDSSIDMEITKTGVSIKVAKSASRVKRRVEATSDRDRKIRINGKYLLDMLGACQSQIVNLRIMEDHRMSCREGENDFLISLMRIEKAK